MDVKWQYYSPRNRRLVWLSTLLATQQLPMSIGYCAKLLSRLAQDISCGTLTAVQECHFPYGGSETDAVVFTDTQGRQLAIVSPIASKCRHCHRTYIVLIGADGFDTDLADIAVNVYVDLRISHPDLGLLSLPTPDL